MASSTTCPLTILFFLTFVSHSSSWISTNSQVDQPIMYAFREAVNPSPSTWLTGNFCTWDGVTCDEDDRVSAIILNDPSLSGTLPTSLSSLTQLQNLYLMNTGFTGPFPSLANLPLLENVTVWNNKFTSISVGTFANLSLLSYLIIRNNDLSPWNFPCELVSSKKLAYLKFYGTNMHGQIPDIFDSFRSLWFLNLATNNLSGPLPNSFTGLGIQNLSLHIQVPGLSGPIDVLVNMPELFHVNLRGNKFTGIIPPSFLNLHYLKFVDLSSNIFQGPTPSYSSLDYSLMLDNNGFCRPEQGADCDPQVSTLLQIAASLNYPSRLAEAWSGNDACKQWSFVNCDPSGKYIVLVNLSGLGFSGSISSAFANLTSLRELYLSDNNLTGNIPDSLTSLVSLTKLDISNNSLSGRIPVFATGVSVLTTGNDYITGNPSQPWSTLHKYLSLNIILPVVIGFMVFFVVIVIVIKKCCKKLKQQPMKSKQDIELELQAPIEFKYKDLETATRDFKKKLGFGGSGQVFYGVLKNGTKVAVKYLTDSKWSPMEFKAEVHALGCASHLNIVKLVGYCVDKAHNFYIVYEYASNGSLDEWIFNDSKRRSLSWDKMRKIIFDIAKGLHYLHDGCPDRILHLDVKPQNVLLDDELNAKLSDLGMATRLNRELNYVRTQARGTSGYMAPENVGGREMRATEKADVYSFGVLIVEILSGRKLNVHSGIEITDPCVRWGIDMQENALEKERIVKLAVRCLNARPEERPMMFDVLKDLEER